MTADAHEREREDLARRERQEEAQRRAEERAELERVLTNNEGVRWGLRSSAGLGRRHGQGHRARCDGRWSCAQRVEELTSSAANVDRQRLLRMPS